MIQSFRDAETARVSQRERSRRLLPDIQGRVIRKLILLHAADTLDDLRVPPGNHLEQLSGDREGLYSLRVTDRWRLCFRWQDSDAYDVEIVDYH